MDQNWNYALAAAKRAWNASTGTNTATAAHKLRLACEDHNLLAAKQAISMAAGAAQIANKWEGAYQQAVLECDEAIRALESEQALRLPTIHLNGTSRESLLQQVRRARITGNEFQAALQEMAPHERDYYPQGPGALAAVSEQHRDRMKKVHEILGELAQIADHIADV